MLCPCSRLACPSATTPKIPSPLFANAVRCPLTIRPAHRGEQSNHEHGRQRNREHVDGRTETLASLLRPANDRFRQLGGGGTECSDAWDWRTTVHRINHVIEDVCDQPSLLIVVGARDDPCPSPSTWTTPAR